MIFRYSVLLTCLALTPFTQAGNNESALKKFFLHDLAYDGNFRGVSTFLMRNPSAVDQRNRQGMTPLLVACQQGCLYAATTLLLWHADGNVADQRGRTPLMAAAAYGDIALVRLLARYVQQLDATDKHNNTAFTYALLNGHHHIARYVQSEMNKRFRK